MLELLNSVNHKDSSFPRRTLLKAIMERETPTVEEESMFRVEEVASDVISAPCNSHTLHDCLEQMVTIISDV